MKIKVYKLNGWAARDADGGLFLGYNKPKKYLNTWVDFGDFIELPKRMFPDLTFDNSPIPVEIRINK